MREEITEPQHWRASQETGSQRNNSWTSRRRTQEQSELAAEVVDAALESVSDEASDGEDLNPADIVSTLANQLNLLEQQREQIQRLLDQAQGI